ncbi:MAG: hypothetical protein IPO37_25530 [Saprospiraceae bacterium]|nr:hypothetical protein [Saprospiraceae bacterium]
MLGASFHLHDHVGGIATACLALATETCPGIGAWVDLKLRGLSSCQGQHNLSFYLVSGGSNAVLLKVRRVFILISLMKNIF